MKSVPKSEKYYDEEYVISQTDVAVDNINLYKRVFLPHVTNDMTVLDFGCGAGILLKIIECKHKIGIDINEEALRLALSNGVHNVYKDLNALEVNSVDLIISNSTLQHVADPHNQLRTLHKVLKPKGKIVFRVPHETLGWGYKAKDWNYHLFTWSPLSLGNLFNDIGFSDIQIIVERGKRPPFFKFFQYLYIEKPVSYIYRLFRLLLDELSIYRIGVDGYIIIHANK